MEKLNIQQARRNNYEIANVTIFNDPKFARAVQRVIIVDKCRLRSKQRNVLDIGNFRNGFSNKEQEDECIIISCEIRLFQSKTNLLKFKSSDTIAIKCLFTTLNHYI
ncbi:unnamed protein product [Onchocerca ochengi]|uniref:ZP domain-containing protein n=1 Tax=Onchocerca ochengi TaxID=42157 RepID=A0A182EXQ5_ONCOC|nr:unnamed protein product [Onchocerca ochengi]